jgi:hypothetical protein
VSGRTKDERSAVVWHTPAVFPFHGRKEERRRLLQFLDAAWTMMSEPDRAAYLQRERDNRERLVGLINRQFAVVRDGSRAGRVVNLATGDRANRQAIDVLFSRVTTTIGSAAEFWLRDERRREISTAELQEIEVRYTSSKPHARRSKSMDGGA